MVNVSLIDKQGLPLEFIYDEKRKETIALVIHELVYNVDGIEYIVPKGFPSDGASIPRLCWRVIGHPFDMKYLREAVLHDWMYNVQPVSRKEADDIFEQLLRTRVSWLRRKLIYRAVRTFGWVAWNNNAKLLQKQAKEQEELTNG